METEVHRQKTMIASFQILKAKISQCCKINIWFNCILEIGNSLKVIGSSLLHWFLSGIQREYSIGIIIGLDHHCCSVLTIYHGIT